MGEWETIRKIRKAFLKSRKLNWELMERGLPGKGTGWEKEHLGQKLQHVQRI